MSLAFFGDSRREKLLMMFESMSRKQLDDRNLVDRKDDIYDESAIKYNDPAHHTCFG